MELEQLRNSLRSYAKLERVLALLCVVSPLLMIAGDGWNTRESISAFYDMNAAALFYFPLTVAAVLFLVNGFVKGQNMYNAWLGVALSGVVLFNHHDFPIFHGLFAGTFFVGNALAMVFLSKNVSARFRIGVLGGVVLAFLAWQPFGWYTLFVAQWISLALIATHFLLDASTRFKYQAAERGEATTPVELISATMEEFSQATNSE
jgi:hypothetical protein